MSFLYYERQIRNIKSKSKNKYFFNKTQYCIILIFLGELLIVWIWLKKPVHLRLAFFFLIFLFYVCVSGYETKFKNGFHNTIHTFKNYFATVFSIFNF